MAVSPNPMHFAKHIKIRSNGKEYPTLEGGDFTLHGFQRDPVTGYEVHGFTKTAVPAKISVQVPANFYTDFEGINDQENATIEVEIDTGQIYLMANAWCVTPINVASGNFVLEYQSKKSMRIQ